MIKMAVAESTICLKVLRFFVAQNRFTLFLMFSVLSTVSIHAQEFVTAQAQRGEGIFGILRRYQLPTTDQYIHEFQELNADILGEDSTLRRGVNYRLPILRFEYDGVGIRTTIGIDDVQLAAEIQTYNQSVYDAGLRKTRYTTDNELWVPFFLINKRTETRRSPSPAPPAADTSALASSVLSNSIYGSAYRSVPIIDRALEGHYIYLVSGHGGPDPGAIGNCDGVNLHEDEYAYDVTLRLARVLQQHGATVFLIVQDPNDGIRDTAILPGDHDERYIGGVRISRELVPRLQKRADIINELYHQNRDKAKEQYTVIIHVDSRSNSKRIDLYYYYQRESETSRRLAQAFHKHVKEKYDQHQPGRGYNGTVATRNLFMLKHLEPPTVYIEIANIRNQRDQDRLLIVNNRQAVANWLGEGIIEFSR
jgi:N-acetylmuramoyl-L-alanine amidase